MAAAGITYETRLGSAITIPRSFRHWPPAGGLAPVGDPTSQKELGAGETLGNGDPKTRVGLARRLSR
jgi:hypothetical protein